MDSFAVADFPSSRAAASDMGAVSSIDPRRVIVKVIGDTISMRNYVIDSPQERKGGDLSGQLKDSPGTNTAAQCTHPMFPFTLSLESCRLKRPKGALMKCVTGPTSGTSEKTRWTPMYWPTEPKLPSRP